MRVPTPTDDRSDLLIVIAGMRAALDDRDEFRGALKALIAPTRQEKGYVNCGLHRNVEDPDLLSLYENWDQVTT
jgi:quinol monooxygenase YgiN